MDQIRQGDVFLERVKVVPSEATPAGSIVAHGENGHTHRLEGNAAVLTVGGADPERAQEVFVEVTGTAQLVHEEHGTIVLDPGVYRRVPQREYVAAEIERRVID